jgi:hypothetical protein
MKGIKFWGIVTVLVLIAIITFAVWGLDRLEVIDRRALDWSAFATLTGSLATLFTGLAAVAGAVWIGRRQVGISERQTMIQERQADILKRQVQLQELTLNSELYDKRVTVYDAAVEYLTAAMSGNPPNKEISNRFHHALAGSRFILRDEVHEQMRSIFTLAKRLEMMNRLLQRGQDTGNQESIQTAVDGQNNVLDQLVEHQKKLTETFSELRLVADAEKPAST